MHHFFVSPETLGQQPVILSGDQAHQVRRVLRMRLGDRAMLLDGRGWVYEAILIAVGESDVRFQKVQRRAAGGEPRTRITLFQAVLKGEHFGWALQKGTEVGITRFVPMICERNVVDDLDAVESKRERWERIILEAAEQCRRGRLPELAAAQLFGQALTWGESAFAGSPAESGIRLIPWEGERAVGLRSVLQEAELGRGGSVSIYVGPEGGFTDDEVALARRYGVRPVTLGPRILRAETAGVVAAALVLYEAGDL